MFQFMLALIIALLSGLYLLLDKRPRIGLILIALSLASMLALFTGNYIVEHYQLFSVLNYNCVREYGTINTLCQKIGTLEFYYIEQPDIMGFFN